MGKRIYLNESQFKDLLRMKLKENAEAERTLSVNEKRELIKTMIKEDFMAYLPTGSALNCTNINDKRKFMTAICESRAEIMPNGRIRSYDKGFGYFEVDNLLIK